MGRPPKVTKAELLAALEAAAGDYLKAAVALQVDLSTIYRSCKRYGIEVETERRITAA